MNEPREIIVQIGEVKIGKKGDLLRATLGSCVGIAFVWRNKDRFALAHCLLPEAPIVQNIINAKYVSQAVPSLISLLRLKAENFHELEVTIAGGGNMMSYLDRKNKDHIGLMNIEAARRFLNLHGISFKELDVGGIHGCQMYLNCKDGEVTVRHYETV